MPLDNGHLDLVLKQASLPWKQAITGVSKACIPVSLLGPGQYRMHPTEHHFESARIRSLVRKPFSQIDVSMFSNSGACVVDAAW